MGLHDAVLVGDHRHVGLHARGMLAKLHELATVEEIARRELWQMVGMLVNRDFHATKIQIKVKSEK